MEATNEPEDAIGDRDEGDDVGVIATAIPALSLVVRRYVATIEGEGDGEKDKGYRGEEESEEAG